MVEALELLAIGLIVAGVSVVAGVGFGLIFAGLGLLFVCRGLATR